MCIELTISQISLPSVVEFSGKSSLPAWLAVGISFWDLWTLKIFLSLGFEGRILSFVLVNPCFLGLELRGEFLTLEPPSGVL